MYKYFSSNMLHHVHLCGWNCQVLAFYGRKCSRTLCPRQRPKTIVGNICGHVNGYACFMVHIENKMKTRNKYIISYHIHVWYIHIYICLVFILPRVVKSHQAQQTATRCFCVPWCLWWPSPATWPVLRLAGDFLRGWHWGGVVLRFPWGKLRDT